MEMYIGAQPNNISDESGNQAATLHTQADAILPRTFTPVIIHKGFIFLQLNCKQRSSVAWVVTCMLNNMKELSLKWLQ